MRETQIQEDVYYILSKLELCNICQFEDFVDIFKKYYFKLDPPNNQYWLEQFFHKLPNPWDELAIMGYPEWLKKINKTDTFGFRINYVLRIIQEKCIEIKAKKQMKKNQITNSKSGKKCCDKILKENWKVGCGPTFSQKRKRRFKWESWKKKTPFFFSKTKKYIRKRNIFKNKNNKSNTKKKCSCYICI